MILIVQRVLSAKTVAHMSKDGCRLFSIFHPALEVTHSLYYIPQNLYLLFFIHCGDITSSKAGWATNSALSFNSIRFLESALSNFKPWNNVLLLTYITMHLGTQVNTSRPIHSGLRMTSAPSILVSANWIAGWYDLVLEWCRARSWVQICKRIGNLAFDMWVRHISRSGVLNFNPHINSMK